jgi:hypothetical protein
MFKTGQSNIGQFAFEQSTEILLRSLGEINSAMKGEPVMPISQERILAGRSYRTVANEQREVSAVEQGEVVYHSVFAGSAGLTVRTPDKRLALARFAAEAQSEVERPLHRPNGVSA